MPLGHRIYNIHRVVIKAATGLKGRAFHFTLGPNSADSCVIRLMFGAVVSDSVDFGIRKTNANFWGATREEST